MMFLRKEQFEDHAIWTWQDDREHVMPVTAEMLLRGDYEILFLKATIRVNDDEYCGYACCQPEVKSLEIFIKNKTYGFSVLTPEMNAMWGKELLRELNKHTRLLSIRWNLASECKHLVTKASGELKVDVLT